MSQIDDFLGGKPSAGSQAAPSQQSTSQIENFLGDRPKDNAWQRGWKSTTNSAAITKDLATGDAAAVARRVKEFDDYSRANPGSKEGQELYQAWDKGDGVTGGIKGVAGEIAKDWKQAPNWLAGIRSVGANAKAMGEGLVAQVPNMLAPMAGMIGGAAAGAAAGSAVPVIGNLAGGVAGGWAGASAGNTLVEGGGMLMDRLQKAGIDPQNTAAVEKFAREQGDAALGDAAIKGGIIGAVDTATAGLAGKILNGPARAAADRALAKLGVNASDGAAVKAATKSDAFKELVANDAAYKAATSGAGNVARNVGAAALDPAGEFAGEFLGQGVATGDWDTKNAALEAISSLGQSALMYGGQKAYQAATDPLRGKVAPTAEAGKDKSSELTLADGWTQPGTRADGLLPMEPGANIDTRGLRLSPFNPESAIPFENVQPEGPTAPGMRVDTSGMELVDHPGVIVGPEPAAREWDTGSLALGNEPKRPSQAMGIDPSKGAISRSAAMAVDASAPPTAEPASQEDAIAQAANRAISEIDYANASPEDRHYYDWEMGLLGEPDAMAAMDSFDDSQIPWDSASNVSTEDFLRSMGASDEEIQDASQPANDTSRTQSLLPSTGRSQRNDAGAAPANAQEVQGKSRQVELIGTEPGERIRQLEEQAASADARAADWASRVYKPNTNPLVAHAAKGGPVDVQEANEQRRLSEISKAQAQAAAARAEAQQLRDAGNSLAAATARQFTAEENSNGNQATQGQQGSAQSAQAGTAPAAAISGQDRPQIGAAAQGLINGASPAQDNGRQAGATTAPQAQAQDLEREQRAARLDAAGQQWTRMPKAERSALVGRLEGIKPILAKNMPGAQWGNLNVDIKRKLADVMQPEAQVVSPGQQEQASVAQAQQIAKEGSAKRDADKKQKAIDRINSEKGAFFFSKSKAEDFVADNGLTEGFSVVPKGKAFVIQAKAASENVAADGAAQNPDKPAADNIAGRDLGDGWAEFTPESGTRAVPRAEMPQIKAEHRGAMVNFMNARGVAHEEATVPAGSLKPTQREFSREKVEKAKAFTGGNRAILTSSDGHVLDGHHQWMAARENGEDVRTIRLDAPIDELVKLAHDFPSSTVADGAQVGAATKAPESGSASEAAESTNEKLMQAGTDSGKQEAVHVGDKPAKAETKSAPEADKDGNTIVGRRKDGVMIRQDKNGVRWYAEGGVRIHETVSMRPTAQGVQMERGELKPEFMTAEESAETKPVKTEAQAEKASEATENVAKKPADYGSKNTLVSQSRAEELRAKLREKAKNHMFGGLDTEMMAWGTELAVFHLEAGVRKFSDLVAAMASDLGTTPAKLKPYLRSWYNGARDMMEDHGLSIEGMDSPDTVRAELAKIEADPSPAAADAANMEAQTRTTETKDENNGNPEQAGRAADQGRTPEVSGRGGRDNDSAAPADSGDLESRKPSDVPAPADAGSAGGDGVRVPAADVGAASPADQGGNVGNGRTRTSGARPTDAGAGTKRRVKAPEDVSPANPGPGNFHIENPLEIVGGTPVARFDKNMAAIELLNQLRESERTATAEEQRTLAGYTGWGSFGQELFQGTWAKAMPKEGWEKRDQWLRDHLGQDEWESAQRSITNAHYTDPPTVMAMWDMAKRMGFAGGRVLEPSMGIGNFFGMMPADIKGRSQLAGIELDSLTGAMATRLYPDANIKIMGYQQSKTPDNFYDMVIGNWPFENTVIADRRYNTLSPFLHDYFFLKALDQVHPGGLVIGITSHGTMDKKATRIRAALARKAELVTSIRLPSGAFQEYAGTKVVTDIVILKKRDRALSMTPNDPWINSVAVTTPAGPEVFINEFYAQNPGNVIGTTDYGHGTTRIQPGMIVHRPENMAERLREAVNLVPEGVFSREDRAEHISYVSNHTADREGSLSEQGGKLYVVRGEHLAPAQEVRKYALKSDAATAQREQELRALIDMRRKYAALIEAERTGDADAARKSLSDAFDAFAKAHGPMGDSFGLDYLRKIDDPFYPALAALEVKGKPSDILTKSTMRGARGIENPTPQDAYVLARNKSVQPTLAEIAQLAGKPEDAVRAELVKSGAVFEAPNGDVVPSDIYLSGNVRQKLREAQAALEDGNKAMERNVAELKKVIPEDVPYFNIESQLGATWVPAKAYGEYVAHMLNRPTADGIEAMFLNGRWKIRLPDGANHWTEARTGFGTGEYPFSKLVNAAFTNQTVKIRRKDSDGNEYVDTAASDEANARIADIRTKFGEWLWSDPERRASLEAEYNEARNAYATPKYDGSFLNFDGMALSLGRGPFNLRQHQVNAIWRALVNRRSLNAHEVGTGKTFTMGGIAVESRRYGIAKKPVLLAHNANSATVAAEIQMMYPAAKVLYIDNLDKDSIAVRMRQIANDDWDTIVLPHSLIDRLSFREDTLMEMAREDIRALEEEAYAAAEEDGVQLTEKMMDDEEELKKVRSTTAKELVKARNRIIETIKKQAMQSSREGAIPFEDLGIDMVLVDESHEFKKPPISTRMNMKGLNTQTSNRSIALQFITRYIRANNFGGNVHTFTGTPITNTLTEIFHQMRYVMEDEMKAAGVESWDGWFGSFAKEVQDVELSAAGEYEAVNRLAGFINVPELRRMIGQYMDVVFADDMPEMQPRKVNGKTLTSPDLTEAERAELLNGRTENAADRPYKKVVNVTSDLTDEQSSIFAELQGYARKWRSMSGKARKEAMYAGAPESPIITEGLANKASFDVRLMNDEGYAGQEGRVPDSPGSKASKVVGNVLEIYNSDHRAAQVIFAEQGFSTSKDKSMGRDAGGKKITRRAKTFSTMRDIVERLVQGGIPREQIAIVDGSTSKEKRKEIANAMNDLRIRVVIGSTDTLGVGVNMQRNLRAMHHMDAPYMPGELEQRNGRGQRQGNQWNTVLEYRYMTDRLDGRRWQILAIKQRFITAFMKANSDSRVIEGDAASDEESDIVQSFSEAAGDPRILIRAKLRKNVEALQRAERMHGNGVADARRNMRNTKEAIEWNRGKLREMTANKLPERLREMMLAQSEAFTATVQGQKFDVRKEAEEAIDRFMRSEMRMEQSGVKVGTYRDQTITARWPSLSSSPELVMEVGGQEFSSAGLRGLEQQIRNYPSRIEKVEANIAEREASIERLEQVSKAPFARAADLESAQTRLEALEKDIEVNPVPPPAWLRAGAPVDSEAFRDGKPFVVTGHRWTKDGWFVLGQDAKGEMAIPYNEVMDAQGMPLYEEREFQAPEVIEKESKLAEQASQDPQDPSIANFSDKVAPSKDTFPAEFMAELAAVDELFAYPSVHAATAEAALRQVDPTIKLVGDVTAEDERSESGADTKLLFRTGQGRDFYVFEKGDEFWLDVSRLGEGDGGNAIYSALMDYAATNDKVFIGDPAGLSDIAMRRRLEAMISSAIKRGSTDHMEPHARQVAGDEALGIPALKWRAGDTIGNVQRMIDVSLASLSAYVPEFRRARYDFATGTFRNSQGAPLSGEVLRGWASKFGRVRAAGAGERTLKRGILLNTLLRTESGQRPRLLEQALRQPHQLVGDQAKGIFYKLGAANQRRPASTQDKAVMQAIADGKSARDVLRVVASGSKDPFLRQTARLLLRAGITPNIEFGHIGKSGGNPIHGQYRGKTDTIAMAGSAEYAAERIFMHEAVHAATMRALAKKGLPALQLRKLLAHVQKQKSAAGFYGTKNVDEFVAEVFTNPDFQKVLRTMSAPAGSTIKTAWDSFVRILRSILGLPNDSTNALSQALQLGVAAMREDMSLRKQGVLGHGAANFGADDFSKLKASALDQISQTLSHPGKVSWWDKSFGTMRNLAERVPQFKPVFESAQRFIDDVSMLANDAADFAPRLIPRVDSWRDLTKKPITAADNKAMAKPLFEGTLLWIRDETTGEVVKVDELRSRIKQRNADRAERNAKILADFDETEWTVERQKKELIKRGLLTEKVLKMWEGQREGWQVSAIEGKFKREVLGLDDTKDTPTDGLRAGIVFTDKELRDLFSLSDEQIGLYREARATIDRSIDMTARADILRALGDEYAPMREMVMAQDSLSDAVAILTRTLQDDARANPDAEDRIGSLMMSVNSRHGMAEKLMKEGYTPLMRFGKYKVYVQGKDGESIYFGLYETQKESNAAKKQFEELYPDAAVVQGTMSDQEHKLFAGVTPESLEMFGNMLGLKDDGVEAQDKAFQDYIRLAKNNHSAMKRMIHRKGTAGFSEDVGRVLASFVYSNARLGSGGLNAGTMDKAIQSIPQEMGELKDVAMGLRSYIQDPQEEGQAIRGMLFAQYLGGSVASAMVNMTQPFQITMPWLSQYGGMAKAGKQMARALKDMATKGYKYEPDLAKALKDAEDDGTVSPQEIHQLMAQARGTGSLRSGDGTKLGDARASASNNWERVKVAWGQPFALAEQFNRRSTFIASYRMAKEQGMSNPADFARKAVLETQFLYSKANKMRFARGAVGGSLMTFKTYSVSYLELMHRMWNPQKQEGESLTAFMERRAAGRRAVGWAVAMLLLMAGAGGLPFMEDAEDLIDGAGQLMGYNISSKQWRKELLASAVGKELGEFMEQGISGLPGAPIDISGRLGLGNLLPGTGLFMTKQNRERDLLEIAGPAGDLVARGFTGARKALTGDFGGAALEAAPTAVRNLVKGADMAASGMYKDTKGYKVMDVTLDEALSKMVGFQPKAVAEDSEVSSYKQRTKSFYIQTSSDIKAQWAQAVFNKDDAALQRVRDRLAAWNRNNPDQPIIVKIPDIMKKVHDMGKDRSQRIIDNSPKALRQQMREMAAEASR